MRLIFLDRARVVSVFEQPNRIAARICAPLPDSTGLANGGGEVSDQVRRVVPTNPSGISRANAEK